MTDRSNTLRILTNVHVLLTKGSYPGDMAPALIEAQQFVATLAAEIEGKENGEQQQEAGPSSGDQASAGGVGTGGVPDQGRKNRRRKADHA